MTTISFRTGAVGLVLGPPLKVRRAPLLEGRRPQFLNPRSHHQRRRGYEDLAGSFLVDLTQPVSHQGLIDAGNGSPRTAYRIHGVDLFKATNETASALTKLASPVKDKADYDRFISGLYHVFREGAGTRLASWPDSFRDVNDLRTLEQHDVDHGSGAKAKRKKLSAAFTKYSGVTSSDAASPEQLLLSQANLLDAISDDLVVLETQVPLLGSVSLTSTSD